MAVFAMLWTLILGMGKSLGALILSGFLAAVWKYKTEVFTLVFVAITVAVLHFAPAYERIAFGVANVVTFGLGAVLERKYASVIDRLFPPPKI